MEPDLSMKADARLGVRRILEFVIGLLVAIAIFCIFCRSIYITQNGKAANRVHDLQAVFPDASGLRKGSPIMLAGVEVGTVKQIALENYKAKLTLQINDSVAIKEDAIASIRTDGIIGEKRIVIFPGSSAKDIEAGGTIKKIEAAPQLMKIISQFTKSNSQPKTIL